MSSKGRVQHGQYNGTISLCKIEFVKLRISFLHKRKTRFYWTSWTHLANLGADRLEL